MISTPLSTPREIFGSDRTNHGCTREFSNINYTFLLTANTVATFTVPTTIDIDPIRDLRQLIAFFTFTPDSTVYVLPDSAPVLALPATDVPAQTLAQINPEGRNVERGQVIQFLTPDTDVYVSVEIYSIGNYKAK